MTQKRKFFGYGSNRSKVKISELLGYAPKRYHGALLHGYTLGYHILQDVKDEHVRGILKEVWGENFAAYSLKPGKGIVTGTVWEITTEDLEKIKEYEFIGKWRDLIPVDVRDCNDKVEHVVTEVASFNIPFYSTVDGLLYHDTINSSPKIRISSDENVQKIRELRALIAKEQNPKG